MMLKKRWSLKDLLPTKNEQRSSRHDLDEESDVVFQPQSRAPPLPTHIEKELKLACTILVREIIPSDFLQGEVDQDSNAEKAQKPEVDKTGEGQSKRISMGDFPMPLASSKRVSRLAQHYDALSVNAGKQNSRPVSTAINVTTNIVSVELQPPSVIASTKAESASMECSSIHTEICGNSTKATKGEKPSRARRSSSLHQVPCLSEGHRLDSTITEDEQFKTPQEHFEPDLIERNQSVDTLSSINSARSSASSGVMPNRASIFSFRNLRHSWSSWMSASSDGTKRLSYNMTPAREVPPLPGLNLWKGDQTSRPRQHLAKMLNRSRPTSIPAQLSLSDGNAAAIDIPKSRDENSYKRQTLGVPSELTVSAEEGDTSAERHRKHASAILPSSTPSELEMLAPYHSAADSTMSANMISPLLSNSTTALSTPTAKSSPTFKIRRKPVPISSISQTDSVMEGQDVGRKTKRLTINVEESLSLEPSQIFESRVTPPDSANALRRPSLPRSRTTYSFCAPKIDTKRHSALPRFQYIDCVTTESPELVSRRPKSPEPIVPRVPLIAPDIFVTEPGSTEKRRPSKLDLAYMQGIIADLPKLYEREVDENTGETSFQRNMSIFDYNVLRSAKYKFADDITMLGDVIERPLEESMVAEPVKSMKKKKSIWPWKRSKKPRTWMDEMEKMGIKDGMLMTDRLGAAPIVRY